MYFFRKRFSNFYQYVSMLNVEVFLGPQYCYSWEEDFYTYSLNISMLNFEPLLGPNYWSGDHVFYNLESSLYIKSLLLILVLAFLMQRFLRRRYLGYTTFFLYFFFLVIALSKRTLFFLLQFKIIFFIRMICAKFDLIWLSGSR